MPKQPPEAETYSRLNRIDADVFLTIEKKQPLLYVGDLKFPISRAQAWTLMFGEDMEGVTEKRFSENGRKKKPTKAQEKWRGHPYPKPKGYKSPHKLANDKPTESAMVRTRAKNAAAKKRKRLCVRVACVKKHLKGHDLCGSHLKMARESAARARSSRKPKKMHDIPGAV